jgi:hypothetical protein
MPITLAPPTITESLDTGELVVSAPTVVAPAPASVDLTLPFAGMDENGVFATIMLVLLGVWVAKMILGLIPRFILIGVGIAILYAYIK